ncbi:MAG: hypothetical protein IID40_02695 [Planctomycetes bacterium]|nr:hypothetical protein [Planctomycetota bacterium]
MLALSFWLPEDISTHGHQIDALIVFVHWFMALLFVGWGIYFVYCLFRFRAGNGRTAQYQMIKAKPSKYSEIAVVAVEAVLLIGFAIPLWAAYRGDRPAADKALTVRVVAQQFAWNIHYPGPDGVFGRTEPALVDEVLNPIGLDESDAAAADDVVSVNEFYIPKDRPVIVRLSSKDVIHSFSIPVLRIKQDAVPGMMVPIWFEATKTGEWDIQCAQLCGLGHYRMRGQLKVLEPAAFEDWYATAGVVEEFLEDDFDD